MAEDAEQAEGAAPRKEFLEQKRRWKRLALIILSVSIALIVVGCFGYLGFTKKSRAFEAAVTEAFPGAAMKQPKDLVKKILSIKADWLNAHAHTEDGTCVDIMWNDFNTGNEKEWIEANGTKFQAVKHWAEFPGYDWFIVNIYFTEDEHLICTYKSTRSLTGEERENVEDLFLPHCAVLYEGFQKRFYP